MNLRELEYLVALAELKHFGRAAERSFVSQPTLSGQIKKMEEHLGVQLLERTNRKVMLTSIGEDIVQIARRILMDAKRIETLASTSRDPFSGPLKIGAFPTISPYLMPHIAGVIKSKYPLLNLYLVEDQTHRIIKRVKDGELDAVILALPEQHDELHVEELFEEPFLLAVPKGHELAKRKSIKSRELEGLDLLLLEDGHCLREQALEVCHANGGGEAGDFRASSLETLRQMVAVGTGITLIPKLAVEQDLSNQNRVSYVSFEKPAPGRRLGLLWRKSSSRSDCMRAIAEIIRKEAAKVLNKKIAI
jgi:LysR family hydrogen peroxide-inducible transcriptional activator